MITDRCKMGERSSQYCHRQRIKMGADREREERATEESVEFEEVEPRILGGGIGIGIGMTDVIQLT